MSARESALHEHGVSTPPVRRTTSPLVVGAADDKAELEADRVADQVLRRLQDGEQPEHNHHVHDGCHGVARTAAPAPAGAEVGFAGGELSDGLSARIDRARGGGRPLDDAVRRRLEPAFGSSLADVRVHTGTEAAALNGAVAAKAFTTGRDIFFGAGEYAPHTPGGERMLAHEVAHTRQGGASARRIHRVWDVMAKKFTLDDAHEVTTLDTRPILFVESDEGKVVVKTEDQPIGLGELAVKMHKKLSKVTAVSQRTLKPSERASLTQLIDTRSLSDHFSRPEKGWIKRGAVLGSKMTPPPTDSDALTQLAKDDAQATLQNPAAPVIVMNLAEGEAVDDLAKTSKDDQGQDTSVYRDLLMNAQHVQELGRVTAVDLFFGNQDRVMTSNPGNWFVNAKAEINLIDGVDPGNGDRVSAKDSYKDLQTWSTSSPAKEAPGKVFASSAKARSRELAGAMIQAAVSAKGMDMGIRKWVTEQHSSGGTRRQFIEENAEIGFQKGAKEIVKAFSATRWNRKGSAHAKKKSIRAAARAAAATDGSGSTEAYYDQLKQRAAYIKQNLK